jgi:hypothetical protein
MLDVKSESASIGPDAGADSGMSDTTGDGLEHPTMKIITMMKKQDKYFDAINILRSQVLEN